MPRSVRGGAYFLRYYTPFFMLNFIARFSVLIAAIVWVGGMYLAVHNYPDGTGRWVGLAVSTAVAIGIVIFGNKYKQPNTPEDNSTTRT